MDILKKKLEEVILEGLAQITVYMEKEDTGLSGKALDMLSEPLATKPEEHHTVKISPSYEISFFFPTYMWDGVSNESFRVGSAKQERRLDNWVKGKIYGREVSADPSGYGFSTWYNNTELRDEYVLKLIKSSLKNCPKPFRELVEIRMTKTYARSWN